MSGPAETSRPTRRELRGDGTPRAAGTGTGTGRGRSAVAIVVGVLGELFITLGVLLGLFVVWQLWWTDVVAEQEQARVIADLDWVVPTPAAPPEEPPVEERGEAPVMDEPEHATTFATMWVPRWGEDYVRTITQGTTRSDVLDVLGIGHYNRTAMPGGIGNFAVAGHRVTYGKPFNRIEELEIGDPIVVQTSEDVWYVYRITETRIVRPEQIEVIAPVPGEPDAQPDRAMMTLTTCHPMYSAQERFIVHAELDYWMDGEDGMPSEITGEA